MRAGLGHWCGGCVTDFLAKMVEGSRERAQALDMASLKSRAADLSPVVPWGDPVKAFGIIAEFKRRAPSTGALNRELAPQVDAYVQGGASAISVLTEPTAFDGSFDDLAAVAARVPVPVMRKDFITDPRQMWETRVSGASGVLLMASILPSDGQVTELMGAAHDQGLFVLLEAHTVEELERCHTLYASSAGTTLLGLNSRQFASMKIERSVWETARPALREGLVYVAESGISQPEDAALAQRCGFSYGLVGTALMRSEDPTRLLRRLGGDR